MSSKTKDKTKAAHLSESSCRRAEREAQRKRKRLLIRIAMITGGILLVAILAIVITGWSFVSSINKKIALGDLQIKELTEVLVEPESSDDPYYVLLIGSDSRDPGTDAGRSDTIILARIDPVANTVSLLSIPRDTKITLEGYGAQKINAALEYYGPAGAVKAVSELCNVDIAHFVEIDFQGLINLVDKLGGVEVNVPVDIRLKEDFIPKGKQHLDGYQALVMSRCRNFPDGDFTRMKNQRVLLQAIMKKLLSSSKTELPGLITELADYVKTDVSATKAISLLLKLQGADTGSTIYMATAPSYTSNQEGISYVVIDQDAFTILMERFKAGLPLEE